MFYKGEAGGGVVSCKLTRSPGYAVKVGPSQGHGRWQIGNS